MEDEKREKYFNKIKGVLTVCVHLRWRYFDKEKMIKDIIEEIWQDRYDKGLEKGTDMFLVELDR